MAQGPKTYKSFTGTGTSNKVYASRGLIVIGDDSSWTATFKVKYTYKSASGSEVTRVLKSSEGTDRTVTDDTEIIFNFNYPVQIFVECTAYTSGTIPVDILGNPIVHGD